MLSNSAILDIADAAQWTFDKCGTHSLKVRITYSHVMAVEGCVLQGMHDDVELVTFFPRQDVGNSTAPAHKRRRRLLETDTIGLDVLMQSFDPNSSSSPHKRALDLSLQKVSKLVDTTLENASYALSPTSNNCSQNALFESINLYGQGRRQQQRSPRLERYRSAPADVTMTTSDIEMVPASPMARLGILKNKNFSSPDIRKLARRRQLMRRRAREFE